MALSVTSLVNFLFKKSQGKSSTNDGRQFFEEPIDGRAAVFPVQVWAQGDLIPTTAPTLADQAVSGVVKRWSQLQLAAVPGTTNAFSSASLKDCIPFNFGDGSYNYQLFDSGGAAIPFGAGDWIVDPAVGTVTFYGTVPANMPPKISFFQYIGAKGLASQTPSSITFTEQSSDPSAPASGFDLLYFKAGPTLYGMNSAGVIRQFATLAGVETLSNKTLSSPVTNLMQVTTGSPPATPAAGSVILFAGTNNSLWSIDSTGATRQLGTLTGPETFTNKTLTAPIIDIAYMTDQAADPTKPAAGTTLLYTKSKRVFIIDSTGTVLQLSSLTGTESLSNKTLVSPVSNLVTLTTGTAPATPASGSVVFYAGTNNSLWMIDSTGAQKQLGTLTGTETFTNKTLVKPIIDVEQHTDQSSDPVQPAAGTTLIYTKNKRLFLFDSTTAPQSVPLQLATLNGTETLTNKTLTAPIVDVPSFTDQSTSPNTPVNGSTLLYSKSGLFYKKSGIDGLETLLGASSSSGSGGKNYLSTLYDGSNVTGITPFNALAAFQASRPDLTYSGSYITPNPTTAMGTGMALVYSTTGTAIGGLTSGSTYYAIRTSNGIQFAASLSDALAKKFITLTSGGSINNQTFTPVASQANAAYVYGSPTGFPDGSPAGLTAAVNTSTPVRSPNSQRLSVDANNRQLSGWSFDITMDKADYAPGQLMKFTMAYQTSANYAGDLLVGIEDTTNLYPVQLNQNYADPLLAAPNVGRYVGYFYANQNSPTYRLTLAIQTTNALGWTLDINELTITTAAGIVPGTYSTPVRYLGPTPLPTMTNGGTGVAKAASPTVDRQLVGRIADSMRLVWQYAQAAAGTAGTSTSDYLYTLPNGAQFDPARATFYTGGGTANGVVLWPTTHAIVAGSINDGSSDGTLFIVPYNATQFRLGATWATASAAARGIVGGSIFNYGANPLNFSIDVLLPILGYDASATYSTNEIALKQVPTSATSAVKTGTLTAAYMAMTGNALSLQPGMYDLGGTVDFNNSGTSPAYSNVLMGWFAANGADSTTAPAALTTLPGLTILGSTPTLSQSQSGAVATVQAPELTIRVTQPVTIYLVPNASATTIANARVTVYALANKRPDYSAFGVYGQSVIAVMQLTASYSPAVNAVILYDTVYNDSDAAYSKTTGLWTCPNGKGGLYRISSKAQVSGASATTYLKIQGVMSGYLHLCNGVSNGSAIRRLTPGQTVGIYTDTATTFVATAGGGICEFTIERIGN